MFKHALFGFLPTLLVFSILGIASPSIAGTNPVEAQVAVDYRECPTGPTYSTYRSFPCAGYIVGFTGWCVENHRTPAPYNRCYTHAHTSNGFSFEDPKRSGVNVSMTMANYAYDASHPGWTRSGTPTCQYVCHGYALNSNYPAITSHTHSVGIYRPDAGWTLIEGQEPIPDCISSTTTHSFKIIQIYDSCPDKIKTRVEKTDASAIYRITYDSPGQSGSNLYEKN